MNEFSNKEKIKQIVSNMTMDELYIALGRYCGPNNMILSQRKYGVHLSTEIVESEIAERLIFNL